MRHNRIQPLLQYGCVALRMRFFPQNFGTIKRILPGSSSPSHREGPGTEVEWLLDHSVRNGGRTVSISYDGVFLNFSAIRFTQTASLNVWSLVVVTTNIQSNFE